MSLIDCVRQQDNPILYPEDSPILYPDVQSITKSQSLQTTDSYYTKNPKFRPFIKKKEERKNPNA